MKLQIAGGTIHTQEETLANHSIYCSDGVITEISEGISPREGYEYVDAAGYIVGPGGIDMHIHGGGGRDFSEGTDECFRTIISTHMRHGTTSLFPTLPSASNKMIRDAAEITTRMMAEEGSPVLGLHLEGPYFNMKKCGGQWPEYIRLAEAEEYVPLLEQYPCIRRWDAAPELPGALAFAKECRKHNVVVGLGHTEADYDDVQKAREAGYTHATHFYNAMTGVHNVREFKHAGTIESVLLADEITVEVIADGIHVPPVIIQLIHKVKGAANIALVTDAMPTTDAPDSEVLDKNTIIEDGVCKLADRSALAGSIATMDKLIDTMINKCHFSWHDAFVMSSLTPARIMAVDNKKGSLAVGKDADIVLYDSGAKLNMVIQAGKVFHKTQ